DPDYAMAWELKSQLLIQLYLQPHDQRRGDAAVLAQARAAAERAVTLDPQHATAQAVLGGLLARGGDFDAGLVRLEEAIRLNPNDVTALSTYADVASRAGMQAQSLAAWATVAALDPIGTPLFDALQARSHLLAGDTEAALAHARRCA